MRKLVLFGVCSMFAASALAGGNSMRKVRAAVPPEMEGRPTGPIHSIDPSIYSIGPGDSLGFTLSDYGSNGSVYHNLINFGDGKLSLGRQTSEIDDATDRGTRYSYSEDGGVSWTPLSWVEGTRQGSGNIDQFPAAGGTEVTYAHYLPLAVCVDAAQGANIWSCSDNGSTGAWPRLAVTDPFNIHVTHTDFPDVSEAYYTRSTDAGVTWDIVDQVLFTTVHAGAEMVDRLDIAAHGTSVAVVRAPNTGNLEVFDVVLAVSTDNGDTWTEETIHDIAGPGELPEGVEEYQTDGTVACVYDNTGILHVTWATFLAVGDVNNDPELFYDITAPIMYWNSADRVVVSITPALTDTTILPPPTEFGNVQTAPDIGVDALGNPFIKFQQYISETDTAGQNYQHIYAMGSLDGGTTWTTPQDITPGTGFDASFGSMANLVDDYIHLTYFSDPLGGNGIRANHPIIPVAVMYHQWPVDNLVTGVKPVASGVPGNYQLDQNYPNPFNPTTSIRYAIPEGSYVTLKVFDALGREVALLVNGEQAAGSYEARFDAAVLANGTYYYRLQAGEFTEARKMMLLK